MSKPTHLISYILHNHPHDTMVESASEVLTPEQARLHLNTLHTFEWPSDITDVRVTSLSAQGRLSSSRFLNRANTPR